MKCIRNLVILAIAALMMFTAGFAAEVEETVPLLPDQISINGQVISYMDIPGEAISQYTVMAKKFGSAELNPDTEKELVIFYSPAGGRWPEDKIRLMVINSDQVNTYQDITVGTPISVVEETFSYEMKMDSATVRYYVMFQGEMEVDPKTAPREGLWLEYVCENGVITKISLYDVYFGANMR